MSTSAKQIVSPDKLVLAGILSIAAIGLIHLLEVPDELEEATYLGLLFLANCGAAVVAAIGIYRNDRWGWILGAVLAAGSFAGYVVSRTVGLPGMEVEDWLQPSGVLAMLAEGLFIGLWLMTTVHRPKRTSLE